MSEDIIENSGDFRFPCPVCGSEMRFDPAVNKLKCPYCGHEQDFDGEGETALANSEQDFQAALDNHVPDEDMKEIRTTTCDNCGARVEFEGGSYSKNCPFCDSPIVLAPSLIRQIKPKGVIPFVLPEKEARAAMSAWLGKLWFAPNNLKEYARKGRKMQGIYVPYWTYDAQSESDYVGQRGTYYYVSQTYTTTVNGKSVTRTRQVRKIRWRRTSGHVSRFFDDVLILASRSLPKRFTDQLAPWGLSSLMDFSPNYIAGYGAEAYSVELKEGFDEAEVVMDRVIRELVYRKIGGDEQRINALSTKLSEITYKHVLLPVWLAAYKYEGKTYRFVVNGQTGKVKGERPWSKIKIALAILAGLVVVVGVVLVSQASQ
ncbi:MAG: primosomal protein N' (replication factor Y) - superfamily II helicase [Rhodobacteraceae bacterium]|nr:primosomal protein N' (replication factor Y) - superfamily II helicase [Paracoccaceae bacterium]